MIAIGCDHGGLLLKNKAIKWLESWGYQVKDFGTFTDESVDYPDYAQQVADEVATGDCSLGVLICGTGFGMSISANKVDGVRAASVRDIYSARMLREHNDGNVLCLGARVTGDQYAKEIISTFLRSEFGGGRHQQRVEKIRAIEKERQ